MLGTLSGGLTSTAAGATIQITNENGTIGGDAGIAFAADSLSAPSLLVQIDNQGGSITGNASIDLNIPGNATTTGDATLQILGSDAAGSSAINVTGGNYDAGGTFLTMTDGNGAITFTNAIAHADVLKVGALGTNGVLTIGGGTLSADTELRLYASGSNGQINFVSNVTLGGAGTKTLAGNTITIFNNVVVTIGGTTPADVYTGFTGQGIPNANYTGFGGNGSTTGTFAGAGANNPQPLASAAPFTNTPIIPLTRSSGNVASGGGIIGGKKHDTLVRVSSTDQLLALLDTSAPAANGKILIPPARKTSDLKSSQHTNFDASRSADRGPAEFRAGSSSPRRRLPQ
ncbi:MAG: hypothetical protein ABI233_01770 [Chthoniobacterales bacterium]